MTENTETPVLDGPLALRLLREVVGERPDYVYADTKDECVYVHKGKPSCLIAHVLNRAGVGIDVLIEMDAWGSFWTALPALTDAGFVVTDDAEQILGEAQWQQDRKEPWGVALQKAEAEAAELGVSA